MSTTKDILQAMKTVLEAKVFVAVTVGEVIAAPIPPSINTPTIGVFSQEGQVNDDTQDLAGAKVIDEIVWTLTMPLGLEDYEATYNQLLDMRDEMMAVARAPANALWSQDNVHSTWVTGWEVSGDEDEPDPSLMRSVSLFMEVTYYDLD